MGRVASSIDAWKSAKSSNSSRNGSACADSGIIGVTRKSRTSTPSSGGGLWHSLAENRLQWLPEVGIGYYPVTGQPYNQKYWERYRQYDATACGDALTAIREELVDGFYSGLALDVGIGGGRFVIQRPMTVGYDVNPAAVAWLRTQLRWFNPYTTKVPAACFWDSLEHIADPGPLLANVEEYAFVSAPIYRDGEDVLRSKHFRRDEHYWYWTRAGIVTFMHNFGFHVVMSNCMEQACGREAIETFVFRREP